MKLCLSRSSILTSLASALVLAGLPGAPGRLVWTGDLYFDRRSSGDRAHPGRHLPVPHFPRVSSTRCVAGGSRADRGTVLAIPGRGIEWPVGRPG